jgi:DNA-binding beta-propeller fold protein YncE
MLSAEGIYEPLDLVLQKAIPYFESRHELKRSPAPVALEEARRANTLLAFPGKIAADRAHNRLAISDSNHHRILITGAGGQLLEAIGSGERGARDGAFEEAQFHHPQGTLFDGDMLYIADTENHLIRVADLDRRVVNTVLGTGAQARAMNAPGTGRGVALNSPWDLVAVSGKLYIAMAGSHQLWVADLKTWEARPYAGSGREEIIDGKLLEAALAQPSGITSDGKHLYFADSETSSIRMADLGPGGGVQTIVGKGLFEFGDVDGGPGRARLQHALGVAFQDGLVYLADTYNSKVKVIDPGKRTTTYAGTGKKALKNGQFQQAAFNEPGGLAWLGGKLYVADTNNHQIRVLDPPSKTVTTLEIIGLEKLARRQMDHFKGRVVDLGEKEIRPDQAQLSLSIKLPAGFRFNRDAPFFLQWKTAGARQPEQLDLKPVQFPVAVPIPKLVKPSEMTIDTVVYYCTEQSVACYVDPIRVKLALKPSAAGTAKLPIEVAVKTPPGL